MRTISKTSALALVLFIALSSLTALVATPADAQTIPPPSVPQFIIQFVNASYGVTTTNPCTGQNQTQQVSNCSVQITIKNQPLIYPDNYHIYYIINMKPHFDGNWSMTNGTISMPSSPGTYWDSPCSYATYILGQPQSNYNETIISFPTEPNSQDSVFDIGPLFAIPVNGQIDFQVQALIGHTSTYWVSDPNAGVRDAPWRVYGSTPPPLPPKGSYVPAIAYDSNSSWSGTQTVTIGQAASPSWASPTCESPALPAYYWLIALALLVSAILIAAVLRYRKTTH